MKKIVSLLLSVLLLAVCARGASAYESREELRAAYRAVGESPQESPYAEQPAVSAPYRAGLLTDAAQADALAYLNFLRSVAGLEPVALNRIYGYRCQNGAALLGAVDFIAHEVPQPSDMDDGFYESAHLATTASNLAKFNWMRPTIIREGLAYFVRDDGDGNLSTQGHRRWLLNPYMAETGFGLANGESGMSYVVMYAHDFGNTDAVWSEVAWPAAGVFPVELMHSNLAWSVSLNPWMYDMERSNVRVTLTEATQGLSFGFDCSGGVGDGFCMVSTDGYGAGACVIFRPDFTDTGFTDYQQNQVWRVRVSGLTTANGGAAELDYTVEMASLHVQEVANIEMSVLEAEISVGEQLALFAAVIPAYADDLSVTWSSSDEAVCEVDDYGLVTAVGAGSCEIIARSANGRYDVCVMQVTENIAPEAGRHTK